MAPPPVVLHRAALFSVTIIAGAAGGGGLLLLLGLNCLFYHRYAARKVKETKIRAASPDTIATGDDAVHYEVQGGADRGIDGDDDNTSAPAPGSTKL